MIGKRHRGQRKKQLPSYSQSPNGELMPQNRQAFRIMLKQMRFKFGSKAKGSKCQKLANEVKVKIDRLARKASYTAMRLRKKLRSSK